jgi:hypothetical protein
MQAMASLDTAAVVRVIRARDPAEYTASSLICREKLQALMQRCC